MLGDGEVEILFFRTMLFWRIEHVELLVVLDSVAFPMVCNMMREGS